MDKRHVDVTYMKDNHYDDCDLVLESVFEGESRTINILLYSNGSHSIGYVSYSDSGDIWGLEVFPEHRGNDYGRTILKDYLQSSDITTHKLNPITEELVGYYESVGFTQTSEYDGHLSEFPIMEINL